MTVLLFSKITLDISAIYYKYKANTRLGLFICVCLPALYVFIYIYFISHINRITGALKMKVNEMSNKFILIESRTYKGELKFENKLY